MVEYNVIYDEIKNLRNSEGVQQKNVTITRISKKRGEKLVREMKNIMPKNRNDWDFSFLVEFLLVLMDSNFDVFKQAMTEGEAKD